MGYYKLNQEVILIVAAVADIVFLLEQINSTAPGTLHITIDLANAIFSVCIYKNH